MLLKELWSVKHTPFSCKFRSLNEVFLNRTSAIFLHKKGFSKSSIQKKAKEMMVLSISKGAMNISLEKNLKIIGKQQQEKVAMVTKNNKLLVGC